MDCIFCKIIKKELPATIVYEDDDLLAFRDISPQAKTHILIIPKKHIANINEIEKSDLSIISKIYALVQKLTKEEGIDQSGYRTVINCNEEGGQTVYHLHLHILGGQQCGGSMVG